MWSMLRPRNLVRLVTKTTTTATTQNPSWTSAILPISSTGIRHMTMDGFDHNNTEVFIRGLSESARKDKLMAYMEQFGQVEKCQVYFHPVTGKPRRFAVVKFSNAHSAAVCVRKKVHVILQHKATAEYHLAETPSPQRKQNKASAANQRSAGSFTGFFKFKRLVSNMDFLKMLDRQAESEAAKEEAARQASKKQEATNTVSNS